ncbi:MAG: 4-(cytidine 5'-diphospho)-2-C-methyl-D-erythritol kinase, partial [Candidatus Gastranaerophilales bacterium]|nr:4-(cytidine 5'-diphospho)-2-C-methyl-D-erythritol kinase [Candidatus Gastranaerophilales bacterium]
LTFNITNSTENKITLRGNSDKIPYDEKNIIYKVLKKYIDEAKITHTQIEVDIEKNIPTEAGLAGGSTNAAGALKTINLLFDNMLPNEIIHKIAASVGSDLNFCLEGGACLLSSRGEIIDEKLPFKEYNVIIVKPKNISVSTKLCYQNFSKNFFEKKTSYYSKEISNLFKNDFMIEKLSKLLYNDLEKPALIMHPELQTIKDKLLEYGCLNVLMSGSGSSIFGLINKEIEIPQNKDWDIFYVKSTEE